MNKFFVLLFLFVTQSSSNEINHTLTFNEFYPQLFACSARFGYVLRTPTGKIEHVFMKQVEQGLECKKYELLAKDLGKTIDEKKNELVQLFENQTVDKCNKLANIGNEFITKKPEVEKENKTMLAKELGMLDQIKIQNIQDVHNVKALKGSLCVTNSAFRDLTTYYILESKIKEAGAQEEAREVFEDGELIESCYNVQASGSNNIKGFKVKVEKLLNKKMTINFDNYSIPDRIRVKQGSRVVFDSGCVPDDGTKEFSFAGSKGILSVEIDGDCSNPESKAQTSNWSFNLKCNKEIEPEKLDPKICYEQIDKYLSILKEIFDLEHKTMDAYWSQSMCYYKAHNRLVDDFMSGEKKYLPLNMFMSAELQNMYLADKKEYESRKKNIKTKIVISDKVEEALFPKYNEFKENRFKYCGMRPKKTESLFKTISFAYCFYGYLRLFDEKDPIFN